MDRLVYVLVALLAYLSFHLVFRGASFTAVTTPGLGILILRRLQSAYPKTNGQAMSEGTG